MPTTVTKVIGTGGDYSTITLWEAALPANLVSGDTVQVGECKNQTFNESVTISGQTTDATHYVHLKCQAGASFSDQAGVRTTALAYSTSNGMALAGTTDLLTISTNYTRVTGLQISTNNYGKAINITSSVTNCLVSKCICKLASGADAGGPCLRSSDNTNVFANCLIQGDVAGAENTGASVQAQLRNCTFAIPAAASNIRTGVISGYSNCTLVNCAIFGFAAAESGTLHAGSSNNATDKSSAGGSTNDVTNLTYASQFVNSANDWRAVDTGGLHAGTPDSTYAPDDISGQTRSGSTPYIGCWEVAGGAPTITGPLSGDSRLLNSPLVGGRLAT